VAAPESSARPGRSLAIDIFCRVVDNFGDAGVCWRLARQLAREQDAQVTLWIDRPEILARFAAPGAAADVRVESWEAAAQRFVARDVVLCGFGCELPPPVRRLMATPGKPPLWVNLEYLSAERWVDGCHRVASPKPADGAIEWFYYPGFSPATGGLIREAELAAERAEFLGGDRAPWLAARGLDSDPGALRISLLCYPQAPVGELLAELSAHTPRPVHLLLPEGVAEEAVRAVLGRALPPGQRARAGALTIARFPFLDQSAYDRLLWSCELNFVRGEDSWIRAHWAHRPFLWQPYPQTAGTHLVKLDAFLARMLAPEPASASVIRSAMLGWNGAAPFVPAWRNFAAALPRVAPNYQRWAASLEREPDLASRLCRFFAEKL